MSKDLFCAKCHCKVAEVEAESKLMVGMITLCPRCSQLEKVTTTSEVDYLRQLFGMR